jgi:hypothetical protein
MAPQAPLLYLASAPRARHRTARRRPAGRRAVLPGRAMHPQARTRPYREGMGEAYLHALA